MSFGISDLLKDWYPFMRDGPITFQASPLAALPSGAFLWTHYGMETGLYRNMLEARLVLLLAGLLAQQGTDPKRIAILSPYTQQIKTLGSEVKVLSLDQLLAGIHIGTVDSFQGEERDVIIVSLVRSNSKGKLGFLADDHRKGVLLSRAKISLFLVGNRETLKSAENWDGTLRRLVQRDRVRMELPVYCTTHRVCHLVSSEGPLLPLLMLCKEELPRVCCSLQRHRPLPSSGSPTAGREEKTDR
ncbi:MAG: hypothetical protein GY819_05130 [Planctomycetaceae bacterium]|nr:hypothetical protein [Planctomycetaceae bacterium]